MKRIKIRNLIVLIVIVTASCSSNSASNTIVPDSDTQGTAILLSDTNELVKNAKTSQYNNFARLIAGLPQHQENPYSKTEKDSLWVKYARALDAKWSLMTTKRTTKLIDWASEEIPDEMRSSDVLFYAFSGADILNANLLFPQTKACYMFGLEPVGFLPNVLLKTNNRDSLQRYFNALNMSLNAITNFSFFRTKSMAVDFKADELNGTIHLMLLFLVRNGNTIADVKYVYIDENGVQQENSGSAVRSNDGVEILFVDSTMESHTVTYYSVNLDNAHLESNRGAQLFIKNLGGFNSYLKAASYLMHRASFSVIRNVILEQSKYLLQDDSGIPYRFFNDKSKWSENLYGSYVHPISLFEMHQQNDLYRAYRDSSIIHKPLNFGIGYNYNQSNLMLFEKK